jgi:hypothetical protein
MTTEQFEDRFVVDYKLDMKAVVEFINELEAKIYEQQKENK